MKLLFLLLSVAIVDAQNFELRSAGIAWELSRGVPSAAVIGSLTKLSIAESPQTFQNAKQPTVVEELGITDTVDITCTDADTLTSLVLGKQVAKIAQMYICFVTNQSAEAVSMSEGALLKRVPQLLPYDSTTFQLALRRVVTVSVAERIIRLLADPAAIFLALGVPQIVHVSRAALTGVAVYNQEYPYIQSRIKGVELPIQANYQALAIVGSIQVAPGDTVITHIFGRPQKAGPGYAQVRISVANAPRVRSIR